EREPDDFAFYDSSRIHDFSVRKDGDRRKRDVGRTGRHAE
ncbi:MAG: hypothetical protein HW416_3920, partial [Chloroflexi bacterium]|nr:hypothetical protein [Chloroflexota bacterium]